MTAAGSAGGGAGAPDVGHGLVARHTLLSVIAGSRAHGLATDGSDTDRRGVYAAPPEAFWRFGKPPDSVEGPLPEQLSWEVERFCKLCLAANPTALEVLHSPLVERRTPLGEELRALAPAFLSRHAYRTFGRYAQRQADRARARRQADGEVRWKQPMHLLRLLLTGAVLLETGRLCVRIAAGEQRERLLAVRRGELTWAEIDDWRQRLLARLDRALEHSPLPAEPDTARVETWLVSVRHRTLGTDNGEALR
ncbi:nucleotidyltransferase domain-containing protein [Streptomyces aidingensis]|uniref:Nucleotidyltransferase n=1 Tax=Streptomyces aidingensis TaxID=910347 RepID=A0A1I1R099_9ACTN|nr:nucleotidyltransferase domain-containing protein [Streptomyces aidingensis]SFD27735.1 hypothetical protein SAMN05421773_112112 [Streptomyces aidingensis]